MQHDDEEPFTVFLSGLESTSEAEAEQDDDDTSQVFDHLTFLVAAPTIIIPIVVANLIRG